jgi:hypothetical protein
MISFLVMKAARQVLGDAARMYALHWRALLMTAGLLLIPVTVIKALAPQLANLDAIPSGVRDGMLATASKAVLAIVEYLVMILSANAVIFFLARDHVGQPIDWRNSWQLGLGRARPAITAALAALLPIFGFMFLFALPAVITGMALGMTKTNEPSWVFHLVRAPLAVGLVFISVRLAFVSLVAAIEQRGSFAAYGRNLDLLDRRFWKTAAVLAPIEIARQLLTAGVEWLPIARPLIAAGDSLVIWLFLPLETAAALRIYLQARAENEAYDIQKLSAELAAAPRPSSPPATAPAA